MSGKDGRLSQYIGIVPDPHVENNKLNAKMAKR